MKNSYYVLYQDENSVRKIKEFHTSETGGFDPIAVFCYADFGLSNGKRDQNGVWPVIKADHFSKLEGKLLTVCDATFTDPTQREAFKDLIKSTSREWYNQFQDASAIWAEQSYVSETESK